MPPTRPTEGFCFNASIRCSMRVLRVKITSSSMTIVKRVWTHCTCSHEYQATSQVGTHKTYFVLMYTQNFYQGRDMLVYQICMQKVIQRMETYQRVPCMREPRIRWQHEKLCIFIIKYIRYALQRVSTVKKRPKRNKKKRTYPARSVICNEKFHCRVKFPYCNTQR